MNRGKTVEEMKQQKTLNESLETLNEAQNEAVFLTSIESTLSTLCICKNFIQLSSPSSANLPNSTHLLFISASFNASSPLVLLLLRLRHVVLLSFLSLSRGFKLQSSLFI